MKLCNRPIIVPQTLLLNVNLLKYKIALRPYFVIFQCLMGKIDNKKQQNLLFDVFFTHD